MKLTLPSVLPSPADIRMWLSAAGITATDDQVLLLTQHASSVLNANAAINLTRITEPEPFVRLHIVDSLMPLQYLDLSAGRIIDVGSGAGFPGIPLAIMGCSVTLCEARKKKAFYLERWVADLGLDVPVIALRAEDPALADAEYDWVIMRAVSSLQSLVELSSPLLRQGGRMVAMKAHRSHLEESEAARASKVVGMKLLHTQEYVLAGGEEQRTLYVYQRSGSPRMTLPRRSGMAQTQPLG